MYTAAVIDGFAIALWLVGIVAGPIIGLEVIVSMVRVVVERDNTVGAVRSESED